MVRISNSQKFLLSVFFTSATVSVLASPVRDLSSTQSTNWLILTATCAFVALAVNKSFGNPANKLVKGLMLLGIFDSVMVVFGVISQGKSIFSGTSQQSYLFEYYLQDALYISLAGVLFFATSTLASSMKMRILAITATVFIFISLVILASRGGILAFLGGISFYLVVTLGRTKSTRALYVWALTGIAVAFLFQFTPAGQNVIERFLGTTDVEVWNSARRSNFQELAWQIAVSNPLGIGWNGFTAFTSQYLNESVRSAHSMLLSLCLDVGLLGAIAYLGLVSKSILVSFRKQVSTTTVMVGSVVFAYFLVGLNDSPHVLPVSLGASLFLLLIPGEAYDDSAA
jgi:hypothetical protein